MMGSYYAYEFVEPDFRDYKPPDTTVRPGVQPPADTTPTRNSEALESFTAYCRAHSGERFWQALRNWSKWNFILGAMERNGGTIDTFNIEGMDGTRRVTPYVADTQGKEKE